MKGTNPTHIINPDKLALADAKQGMINVDSYMVAMADAYYAKHTEENPGDSELAKAVLALGVTFGEIQNDISQVNVDYTLATLNAKKAEFLFKLQNTDFTDPNFSLEKQVQDFYNNVYFPNYNALSDRDKALFDRTTKTLWDEAFNLDVSKETIRKTNEYKQEVFTQIVDDESRRVARGEIDINRMEQNLHAIAKKANIDPTFRERAISRGKVGVEYATAQMAVAADYRPYTSLQNTLDKFPNISAEQAMKVTMDARNMATQDRLRAEIRYNTQIRQKAQYEAALEKERARAQKEADAKRFIESMEDVRTLVFQDPNAANNMETLIANNLSWQGSKELRASLMPVFDRKFGANEDYMAIRDRIAKGEVNPIGTLIDIDQTKRSSYISEIQLMKKYQTPEQIQAVEENAYNLQQTYQDIGFKPDKTTGMLEPVNSSMPVMDMPDLVYLEVNGKKYGEVIQEFIKDKNLEGASYSEVVNAARSKKDGDKKVVEALNVYESQKAKRIDLSTYIQAKGISKQNQEFDLQNPVTVSATQFEKGVRQKLIDRITTVQSSGGSNEDKFKAVMNINPNFIIPQGSIAEWLIKMTPQHSDLAVGFYARNVEAAMANKIDLFDSTPDFNKFFEAIGKPEKAVVVW